MSAANDMTDSDRYEELVEVAKQVIDKWPSNDLAPAVNELRETLEAHGQLDDEDADVEVEFRYSVLLQESQLEQDEEGRWVIKAGAREQAYEIFIEGVSDTKGDWMPRYSVLCKRDFMAGQICERERGHEGDHR